MLRTVGRVIVEITVYIVRVYPGFFWLAKSPAEFWTRWNPGVHQMFIALHRRRCRRLRKQGQRPSAFGRQIYTFAAFLVMGVYHDVFLSMFKFFDTMSITFTSTVFFCVNGLVVVAERGLGLRFTFGPTLVRRLCTTVEMALIYWLVFFGPLGAHIPNHGVINF